MARRKSVKYETKRKAKIVVFILTLIVIICGRFTDRFDETPVTSPVNYYISDEEVRVHIIDVGQGSSALIQCGKDGILIDGGEREYGRDLITYINRAGVTKLKYVVASHPHTDHIGGLLNVLDVYEVENIIMPKLSSINTPTTKTYENFLLKIKEKGIKAIAAKFGENIISTIPFLKPSHRLSRIRTLIICLLYAGYLPLAHRFFFPAMQVFLN